MQYTSLIERLRSAKWFMRITAFSQTFCFLFVFYSPSVQAVTDNIAASTAVAEIQGKTDEEKLSKTLQAIKENVIETKVTIDARAQEEGGITETLLSFFGLSELRNESLHKILGLNEQVQALNGKAMANFASIEAMLKAKNLPGEILQRHYDAVSKYQVDYAKLQMYIQNCSVANSLLNQQSAMDELDGFLQQQQFKRTHQTDDPNNLPFGTPNADDTRKPITDSQQLSQLINGDNGNKLAEKLLNAFISQAHAAGPAAEDLAETIDVQLTDAIRVKAQTLNNSPVEIYNWVRNNIEFIPTYGSIQGADYTLQTLSGNPFDTASLLIALLRASNIPARYAYGTVRIPVDQVMNWVGGVEVPAAAQQLLGQGGIPNIAQVNAGKITHIKMEHIWVEAWVDFEPSRGAKNFQGDSWVPMDGSFKQYEFTQPQDFSVNVPFDGQGLLDQIGQTAIVNETEGFLQGVSQADVDAEINAYQTQIEDFVDSQNPDTTLGEILGIQKVILKERPQLASGLPYQLVARTNSFSTIPDNLRHKFRYTIGTEIFGTENNRLITFEKALPELTGKKLALSFKPASQADENLVNSFLPAPDPNTGAIDPSLLPSNLPGYLISFIAEFTQDGEVIESATAGTMGGVLYESLALWSPAFGWDQAINHPVAGEYRAIGLGLQGATSAEAAELQSQVEATKLILEGTDEAAIAALTKHVVLGDLLFTAIYSYLALNDVQNRQQAQTAGVVNYRLPSFGLFTTSLQTSYFFGLPRDVSFAGLVMDVDRLAVQVAAKDNNAERVVNYVLASGTRASALEHVVPEQMFSTVGSPAQGVSAVKALAIALAEGQRVWTIDASNLNDALAAINLDSDIESEIRNAVFAGKVVTAHEQPINFAGGQNTGYLIIDPATGSGAYLIASGVNGGFLSFDEASILGFIGFSAGVIGASFSLPILVFIALAIAIIIVISLVLDYLALNHKCTGLGGLIALGVLALLVGAFTGGVGAIVVMYIGLLAAGGATAAANSSVCKN